MAVFILETDNTDWDELGQRKFVSLVMRLSIKAGTRWIMRLDDWN